MLITRLTRAFTALALVVGITLSGTACAIDQGECPAGTATFPILGTVVKKSVPRINCYILYIRLDNSAVEQTVRVSRYRYLHVESRGHVMYSSQPTD